VDPKIYLVGGAVRDHVLGVLSKDRDYVVVGATPEWMIERGFKRVGADFPVFLHPETRYEYALARQERKTGPGYHGFDTRFDPSITLEDDLRRRDLTINAMAMTDEGEIIDPFGGLTDLKAGVLRHTSEAFAEDPLRVLRVARFAARYDFTIDQTTVELARKIVASGELNSLPRERFWTELWKGFNEKHPSKMISALENMNAIATAPLNQYFGRNFSLDVTVEKMKAAEKKSLPAIAVAALTLGPIDADKANELRVPSDVYRVHVWANKLAMLHTHDTAEKMIKFMGSIKYDITNPDYYAALRTSELIASLMLDDRNFSRWHEMSGRMVMVDAELKKTNFKEVAENGPKATIRERINAARLAAARRAFS